MESRFADLGGSVGHHDYGQPLSHWCFQMESDRTSHVCVISQNWAGQPLDSYETMLKFIRTSTTKTGFHCLAYFDRRKYQSKLKLSPDQKANLNVHYHRLFPEWNYTIRPHDA